MPGIAIDLGSIILTAALTTLGTFYITRYATLAAREDKTSDIRTQARYLAVRVVCVLDPFLEQCVAVTGDDGQVLQSDDVTRVASVKEPILAIPTDVDWKSISSEMMYRILSLPNEISVAKETIRASFDHSGPPDYDEGFSERKYQYAKIGTLAFNIVTDLRAQYDIPAPDYSVWNPKDYLDRTFAAEYELRKRNA